MSIKVWLTFIFICCFLGASCALPQEEAKPVSVVSPAQDTLEMEPDFSYAVVQQKPHIFVDQKGYRGKDKKVAFFYGKELEETFEIREKETEQVVYSGVLSKAKDMDGKNLYTGIFTNFSGEGEYYIHQKQLGDSYNFVIKNDLYDKQYKELENKLLKEKYEDVSSQAYLLANYMFIREMDSEKWINESYIRAKLQLLMNSKDSVTGAFYKEIIVDAVSTPKVQTMQQGQITSEEEVENTISLSTTAQMAGVLAQYAYLYRDTEDAVFINQCLQTAQRAYRYVEKYRDNTDTDAWYYAATQLYRATRQYKYRNAIAQYDTLPVESRSSTEQGYTILADFAYLSTPYGTDYNRCADLLDGYMEKAQNISITSSRENFYVVENISSMSEREILEDMFIMGVVNHVLSGQEYAGVQKNYIHYLSGVNMDVQDRMTENILFIEESGHIDTANAAKMLVIYANLCE